MEKGQDGGGIEILEGLDADEAPDDAGMHRPGDAFRAPFGAYTFIYADGGDQRAKQDALDLAAEEVDQRPLSEEAREEGARVDAHDRHRDDESGESREGNHGEVVESGHKP